MRFNCRVAVLCWLAALVLGVVATPVMAQTSMALTYDDGNGNVLPYRLFLPPSYDPNESYPLVLHLHGAGERGNNNTAQLVFIDGLIAETQGDNPSFLIVPQAPTGSRWENFASDDFTIPTQLTLEVIDLVEQQYSVDTSRRYVTGLSMGGFGTWDLLGKRPGFFEAAFPLSGFGPTARADSYADTRIWTWHGSSDNVVPVVPKREVVVATQEVGGDILYSEVDGGHGIWRPVYDDPTGELYDWVFDGVLPDLATFEYDPATGDVRIDAGKAPGGVIDNFRYAVNRLDVFDVPDTVIVDGQPVPTDDFFLSTNIRELIYSERPAGGGFTGVLEIPGLLPEGLDFLELSALRSNLFYFSPDSGDARRAFSVVVIPEPTTGVLALLGLAAWGAGKRHA